MKKSIYTQLVVIFIGVFIISNVLASILSFFKIENNAIEQVSKQLMQSVDTAKEAYEKEKVSKESIEKLFKDKYITISFINDIEEYISNEEIISSLEEGKTLVLRANEYGSPSISTPIAITKTGDYYIVAKPEFKNLGFSTRHLIMSINIRAIIIGSVLFLFVGKIVVNPTKKLIKATEKVAAGDFDIEMENHRTDEMGILISSFNTMAKELKSIEILRNDFISDISHEFRTPLTSIEGYTKLLRDCNEEERKEYVDIIVGETKRLSILATNILTLNRIDNQNTFIPMENFVMDEQIRRAILLLENKWVEKDIKLEIDLGNIQYKGNPNLLYQVWINLIDNAIKFSPKGETFEIKLYEEQRDIIFSIKDNGIGISKGEQKRIFDKFYKSDKSRNTDGNGLGLSIVKRIVDIHKGKILLKSNIDEGTNIMVRLYRQT